MNSITFLSSSLFSKSHAFAVRRSICCFANTWDLNTSTLFISKGNFLYATANFSSRDNGYAWNFAYVPKCASARQGKGSNKYSQIKEIT